MATCCSCGRTVSWRGASLAQVQALRTAQARHVAVSKRMRTTGPPRISCPGVHLTLVCPSGHRACCDGQSMDEGIYSIALASTLLPAIGTKRWTDHIDLMQALGAGQEVGVNI